MVEEKNTTKLEKKIDRYSYFVLKGINELKAINNIDEYMKNDTSSFMTITTLLCIHIKKLNELDSDKINQFKSQFEDLFDKHPGLKSFLNGRIPSTLMEKNTTELENRIVNTINKAASLFEESISVEEINKMLDSLGRCNALLNRNRSNFSSERYEELSRMVRGAIMRLNDGLDLLDEEANLWRHSR